MAERVKPCERCSQPTAKGYRFCKSCKEKALNELYYSGYLHWSPTRQEVRTADMKESIHETKFGTDHYTTEDEQYAATCEAGVPYARMSRASRARLLPDVLGQATSEA